MHHWDPGIAPEKIREELDEAPAWDRHRIIRQHLPIICAAHERVPQLIRPLRLAFRRAVVALEGRAISVDEEPGIKLGLRVKEVGALFGYFGALGFEFLISIVVCIQVLGMRAATAVLFGMALSGFIALMSKAVAATAVEFERLASWKRWLIACGAGAFAAALMALALLYAARNGVLPAWVISVVTPFMPIVLGVGATAFSALAHVYAHPRKLYEEIERLEAIRTRLGALKSDLSSRLAETTKHTAKNRQVVRTNGRRRRVNGVATGVMALAVVALSSGLTATDARSAEIVHETRVCLMPDATDTGDQTGEAQRIRDLLGASVGGFCEALGGVSEVVVLPWGDAESIWRSGQAFRLPALQAPEAVGEAKMEFFRPAFEPERQRLQDQARANQDVVYRRIASALAASPTSSPRRSCVTEALNRAAGMPAGTFVVLPTDLADYRCPSVPQPSIEAAVVCVIVIPRRDGADMRRQMLERRAAFARNYPDVLLVDSFNLTDSASVVALGERMLRVAGRRRP